MSFHIAKRLAPCYLDATGERVGLAVRCLPHATLYFISYSLPSDIGA